MKPQLTQQPAQTIQTAYEQNRIMRLQQIARLNRSIDAVTSVPVREGWHRWNLSLRLAQDLAQRTMLEMEQYYDDQPEEWRISESGKDHLEAISSVLKALDGFAELLLF